MAMTIKPIKDCTVQRTSPPAGTLGGKTARNGQTLGFVCATKLSGPSGERLSGRTAVWVLLRESQVLQNPAFKRGWIIVVAGMLALSPGEGLALESHEATLRPAAVSATDQDASSQKDQREGSEEQDDQEGQDPGSKLGAVHWDRGLHLTVLEGNFEMKVGGEVQYDVAGFADQENVEEIVGEFDGGGAWRRIRLDAKGTLFKRIEYKLNYNFATTSPPHLQDAWIDFKLPFVPLRVLTGRFKAPLGLDGYTPNAALTFLERSTLTSAFLPDRNTGILVWDSAPKHRLRYGFAIIDPSSGRGLKDLAELGWSARFTSAVGRKEGRLLLHSGANFYRRRVKDTIRFQSQPESHLAPAFVDTGDIPAETSHTAVLEAAVQYGSTSLQGEFAYTQVGSTEDEDPRFWGFYVMAGHFLTGETHPYDTDRGTFGRPDPKRGLGDGSGGLGAFEIAFRFSHLDLTDKNVHGGVLDDVSVAFNWYPTHSTRVMTNVIWSKLDSAEAVWIFQVRFQLDI
jgi:phosphate-selective porin OprO/OprP